MLSGLASATTRYVAQSAGTFTSVSGDPCNGQTAITPTTFNSTSLTAGDIAYMCGTLNFSAGTTGIQPANGGSSGNPIIINFGLNATIQAPNWGAGGAGIRVDGLSYVTIDGKGTGNSGVVPSTFVANGYVQATLAGTAGGPCIGGPCTNGNPGGTGISATTTTNITIQNLVIRDLYLRTSTTDLVPDWSNYFCIHASPSSNLLINNNTMLDSGEILAPNGNNIEIKNNDISSTNHGISLGAGSTSWSNTYIHDNHIHGMASWDAGTPFPYHHDGIHIFPGSPGFYLSVFIYNNTFDGNIGTQSVTGWIYAEAACCTGGTIWVFNNYATSTPYETAPAYFGIYGAASLNLANNTVASTGFGANPIDGGQGIACDIGFSAETINLAQNNICGTQRFGWNIQNGTTVNGTAAMDYNSYIDGSAAGNSSNFACCSGAQTQSLTTWKSQAITGAATHDAHSQLSLLANYKLNTNGTLQSGSLAIGAGNNLFSTCNGQAVPGIGALCNDKNGVTRPSSGAWDAGAIQFNSTPTVATPTFSPAAGTYTSTQSVTISTTTGGATICYTTDGTTPTANGAGTCTHGTTYTTAVSVAVPETLQAIGSLSGDTDSAVGSAAYVITVVPPTFSPVAGIYTSTQSVTISTTTGSATICYTIDGTTPTANGAGTCTHGTTYSSAVSVSVSLTLKAIGSKSGLADSAVTSGAYTIAPVIATPTFSPVAGTYGSAQSVTITTSTGGATLCYTIDGTTPTGNGAGTCTHGTTYSSAVSVLVSLTLKAIGTESGFTDSTVGSATYQISPPPAPCNACMASLPKVIPSTTTAQVDWETVVPTTATVKYGLTLGYGRKILESSGYVLDHSFQLVKLKPSTTYHLQLLGQDDDGNIVTSPDKVFATQ